MSVRTVPTTDEAVKRATLKLAMRLLREIRKANAEYDEMVEFNARRGYRPSHCRHGYNLWVDYDVICPGCEDPNPPTDYERALAAARATIAQVVHRRKVMDAAIDAAVKVTVDTFNAAPSGPAAVTEFTGLADLRSKMIDWVLEPIDRAHHRL